MTSVHELSYKGDLAAVKVKVEADRRVLSKQDSSGRVALHWAAAGGHAQVAQLLIEGGSEVDPEDDTRWTPLIIASSAGHADVAKILLARGARIDACTDQGRSSLLYACSRLAN